MSKKIFLDIHIIQTIPPSNINRDDTGSPKTAQYGGVMRARVSSQAWKKAMRDYFNEHGSGSNVGTRTLDIVNYVKEKVLELNPTINDEEAFNIAEQSIKNAGISTKDGKAKALFFMGDMQAKALARAALNGVTDKKELQKLLNANPAIDIALFGRMVADDPSLNMDASSQVAHAISTHQVRTEYDFYTALDDRQVEDNAGAGMLGTIEYNSSTLYRYANVNVHELMSQIDNKDALVNTLKLYVEAFSNSMPTGKMNTFANSTLPQAILVTLREDRPVNLVSAFEKPIKPTDGYSENSIRALWNEAEQVNKFVGKPLEACYLLLHEDSAIHNSAQQVESLNALLEAITDGLYKHLNEIGE